LAPLWPAVLGALVALVAAALTPTAALAAEKGWVGGDGYWSDDAHWTGGTAPSSGDDLVFPLGGGFMTNNDYPPGTSFHSINISSGGYTLNGNAVTIADFQSIKANYAGGLTSTINLSVSGSGTTIDVVQTGSTLVFGGGLNEAAEWQKFGPGTMVLSAPGTSQTGGDVQAGIVNVQNGAAVMSTFPIGIEPGATLQVQGGITVPTRIGLAGNLESVSGNNTLSGIIRVDRDSTISADTGATLTLTTNPVQLNNFTLTASVAGTMAIASPIQDTGGLTKTGTGVLTLSGPNTYTGPTTVNAGSLLVNGSQPSSSVTVASGATLGGTGTTGPVTANGILNPGVGGAGVLHSGKATFNAGSTFAVDLNGTTVGTGYDQLFAAGTVTLTGPMLTVSVGFPSATGNTFAIIQSTGAISGGFSGLPEGFTFVSGGRIFRINYTTNAVTLTDVGMSATSTPTVTGGATPTATLTPTGTTCILGDINCDGIVDIRDYGIWRANFGQTNCGNPADLDGTCIVDIRDYGIWRQNFGHTAGAAARTATPLPAPPGAALPTGMAPRQPEGAVPAVPLVSLVGGLLGLGGLAGWRARRPG
jgi:autotransporter-associated beta strand protein